MQSPPPQPIPRGVGRRGAGGDVHPSSARKTYPRENRTKTPHTQHAPKRDGNTKKSGWNERRTKRGESSWKFEFSKKNTPKTQSAHLFGAQSLACHAVLLASGAPRFKRAEIYTFCTFQFHPWADGSKVYFCLHESARLSVSWPKWRPSGRAHIPVAASTRRVFLRSVYFIRTNVGCRGGT